MTNEIPKEILTTDIISEPHSDIGNGTDDEKKHIEKVIDNVINVTIEEKKLNVVSLLHYNINFLCNLKLI